MAGVGVAQFGFLFGHGGVGQQVLLAAGAARNRQQRVGRDDLGFQVGQRRELAVAGLLLDHQADEKAQLGNLHGYGLNVHAVEALFNQVELAGVVGVVGVGKVGVELLQRGGGGAGSLVAQGRVFDVFGAGELLGQRGAVLRFPQPVVGVELAQHGDQLLQHAHGESAGAAGRVKHAQALDGGHQRMRFCR